MKELIHFSLYRRFRNKATITFNIIIFVAIALACFSDKIMNIIDPTYTEKEVVYIKGADSNLSEYLNELEDETYIFKKIDKNIKKKIEEGYDVIEVKKDKYILHTKYEASLKTITTYNLYLTNYHKMLVMNNSEDRMLIEKYNKEIKIENKILEKKVDLSTDKSNLIFMFVTSIYFMMLSFVSGVASEVVNEKSTKTLELLLTSVSAKTHFYAKLIVGWLVIVLQGILSLSYIIFWLLIRSVYDQGVGLLAFINKIGLYHFEDKNFYAILFKFDFNITFFKTILYVVLFLLLGILLMQLILVVISSFVSSVEAGNIQAPFHLLLLGFYYLTLAINNPHELSEGIGYYLSYVPFFNMLLMPCRILIQNVPTIQLVISLSLSMFCILLVLRYGGKAYEKGVLDYSCKGFIDVIKKMRNK